MSPTSLYDTFVNFNGEISIILIKKKDNQKIKIISEDTRIIYFRDKVNVYFSIYSKTPIDSNQVTLRHEQEKLKSEYDNIESQELDGDVQGLSRQIIISKYAANWKLINTITYN